MFAVFTGDLNTLNSELASKGKKLYTHLTLDQVTEHEIRYNEGKVGMNEAILVLSGKFTGRSPKDKFIVKSPENEAHIGWGNVNQPISSEIFDVLYKRVVDRLSVRNLYVYQGLCGADPKYEIPIRIFTEKAWHYHFAANMFIDLPPERHITFHPEFTILNACRYSAPDYKELGLNSEVFIIFNLEKKIALIGGTEYAGEMKKGVFSVMNYHLPFKNIMPMHCAANTNKAGETALFFGLSGTGKTTLSTSKERQLIGDDEHGWSADGVFNFEGGCYAKVINLSREKEPEIWDAIRKGSILENVILHPRTGELDFTDDRITENTRVSYPITFIKNRAKDQRGLHPKYILFLTCDAFGVLPPVAKLTPKQAIYYFLSGYTAKVAGTERGITEPQATFSTCFGSPFMTRKPQVYGDLLEQKIREHQPKIYLVNTGWTGGGYGVGERIDLGISRQVLNSIFDGSIEQAECVNDSRFGFEVPKQLGNIDPNTLNPRNSWEDKAAYDRTQLKLAELFNQNFEKNFADIVELKNEGPTTD